MPRGKRDTIKAQLRSAKVEKAATNKKVEELSWTDRIQSDLKNNQNYLNLILGALIVVVIGTLFFNYFTKPKGEVPNFSQQSQTENNSKKEDVAKENLPGKYTVKEGDTLFTIAQKYYNDGYKYPELVKVNNLTSENLISTGQVLEIPKLENTNEVAGVQATPTPASPSATPEVNNGQGGAENQTIWGENIKGDTYTVQTGDWLSKISGRAYGDIDQFDKIAKANNITNPDVIEVGTVLKIPR